MAGVEIGLASKDERPYVIGLIRQSFESANEGRLQRLMRESK